MTIAIRRASDSPGVIAVQSEVNQGRCLIGYMHAWLIDLRSFGESADFTLVADGVSGSLLDAALTIESLGLSFWSRRGKLLFLDRSEVLPSMRRRGWARAAYEAVAAFARSRARGQGIDVMFQPYPLEFEQCFDDGEMSFACADEFFAKLEQTQGIWRRVMPFASPVPMSAAGEDVREFFLGRIPVT